MNADGRRPSASIIIVTHNTRTLVLACLRSVEESTRQSNCEVTVVDNGSADGTAGAIRAAAPAVRIIETGANLGFGRAINLAARTAHADVLLLLNSDILVQPGCVEALLALFARHPTAGAAGPRLLDPDGSVQHSVYRLPTWKALVHAGTLLGRFRLFRRDFERYQCLDFDPDSEQAVEHVKAAALAVRRDVWERIGGFDPRFFMYYEDLDLSRRLRAAGHEIWYVPGARAIHAGKSTALQDWPRAFLASRESLFAYLEKHEARATRRWFRRLMRGLAAADDLVAVTGASLRWPFCLLAVPERARRHRATIGARLAAVIPTLTGRSGGSSPPRLHPPGAKETGG